MNIIEAPSTSISSAWFSDFSISERPLQKHISIKNIHPSFEIYRQLRRQLSEITIDAELQDSFFNNSSSRAFELEDDEYVPYTYDDEIGCSYIRPSYDGPTTLLDLKNNSARSMGTSRTFSASSSMILSSIRSFNTEVRDVNPPKLPVRVKSNVNFQSLLDVSNIDTHAITITDK